MPDHYSRRRPAPPRWRTSYEGQLSATASRGEAEVCSLRVLVDEPPRELSSWGRGGTHIAPALPVLERCDDEKVPAYLEATSLCNRVLCQRHGFEIIGQFSVGPRVAADTADVAYSQQVSLSLVNLSFC